MVNKSNLKKEANTVVKIDSSLLADVEEFINKEENKFKFVNKKQFIDIAVSEFLQRTKKEEGKNGKKK